MCDIYVYDMLIHPTVVESGGLLCCATLCTSVECVLKYVLE